jgi:acyl-CoA reductase-like NAD-dependent aldehyde dehydrogenase
VGNVRGKWLSATDHTLWEHRNPAKWEQVLSLIPLASGAEVKAATAAAKGAQSEWQHVSPKSKAKLLEAWTAKLEEQGAEFARLMALEVGKPVSLGLDEVRFALDLLRVTASLAGREEAWVDCGEDRIRARRCPLGVVGIITPWNNPVAIPVGKLGPAIAFGNGVVWKAANHAPCTARLVMETLLQAGLPRGLVNVLFGGAETGRQLVRQPEVVGISLTGSCTTGREVASLCAAFPKFLQAELGGNNAAIVMPDSDIERAARELTLAAFSFSGQRCTATRRFIVHQAVRNRFEETLLSCIDSLRLGDPGDPGTDVGPVLSREKQGNLRDLVEEACLKGAKLLCGGKVPTQWEFGCWFEPTLLDSQDPSLRVVQEETFGPIAVLQTVRDMAEALQRLNSVPHGLAASLYSNHPTDQRLFLEGAKCGTLKLNQSTLGVGPEAAFGGWKGSGLGPPEHGIWDLEFYTRPQALYGWKKKGEP